MATYSRRYGPLNRFYQPFGVHNMTSKNFELAHLAAMLMQHTTSESAHTCAELALKLTSLSRSIVEVQTFACNGYKTEHQDKLLNKLSHEGKFDQANEYADKLWSEGAAYETKRNAQFDAKLQKLSVDYGLNLQRAGLSGIRWVYEPGREYFI